MDVHVEVFITSDGASSSSSKTRKAAEAKAAAERIEPSDPLRAAMQSLRIPIGTAVDATNVAEARTQLKERRQQMLDLSEMLAATQHRLDAAQLERNAAYGFTPAGSPTCVLGEERSAGPSAPSQPSTRPQRRTCALPRHPQPAWTSSRVRS